MASAVERALANHSLFGSLAPEYRQELAGCATDASFAAGEFVLREGDPAHVFYLIQKGRTTLETYASGSGPVVIQTLGPGDLLGWSWLFEPYRWHFDARALEPVEAIVFNGACLRQQCEVDPRFGYEMMKRVAQMMIDRLQATRLQMLYSGDPPGAR